MAIRLLVSLRTTYAVLLLIVLAASPARAQAVPANAAQPKASSDQAVYIVQMIDPPAGSYIGEEKSRF